MQQIEANKKLLFKIGRIYQDDAEDREDLLQEMILQLWLAFDSFKGQSKFSTWMYRVALNTAIQFFKKQKRRPDREPLPAGVAELKAQENDMEKDEQLATFYAALQQLNQVEKALIILYMEDQPYNEIAGHFGISEGNVRVRLNRVKNKLKDIINHSHHGDR